MTIKNAIHSVDDYLKHLNEFLSVISENERKQYVEEVKNDLNEAIHEEMGKGISINTATQAALKDFSDPEDLANEIIKESPTPNTHFITEKRQENYFSVGLISGALGLFTVPVLTDQFDEHFLGTLLVGLVFFIPAYVKLIKTKGDFEKRLKSFKLVNKLTFILFLPLVLLSFWIRYLILNDGMLSIVHVCYTVGYLIFLLVLFLHTKYLYKKIWEARHS